MRELREAAAAMSRLLDVVVWEGYGGTLAVYARSLGCGALYAVEGTGGRGPLGYLLGPLPLTERDPAPLDEYFPSGAAILNDMFSASELAAYRADIEERIERMF